MLAIAALALARTLGTYVLDPIMGMVGGIIICVWGYGLLRDTSGVLLDREMDHEVVAEIRGMLGTDGSTKIDDLHVWRIGGSKYACAVSLVTATKRTPEYYRKILESHEEIAHTTIEVTHRGD
jgi:Co/Zn/Cd efflux system component